MGRWHTTWVVGAVAVVALVSAVLFAGIGAVEASETDTVSSNRSVGSETTTGYITIVDATPRAGTELLTEATSDFDATVEFDMGGATPGHMTLSVNENQWGEIDREIPLDSQRGTIGVSIDEYIQSEWEQATLSVSLYPEGSIEAISTDEITYPLDSGASTPNAPPDAEIVCESDPTTGDPLNCDAYDATDSDGSVVSYEWDVYHDGFTTQYSGSFLEHDVDDAGTYEVELTVTDDDGASDTAVRTLDVQSDNDPPSLGIDCPSETRVGERITCTATGSDSDGYITEYDWDFGEYGDGAGDIASYTFDEPGTYTVSVLAVDDADAVASAETTVSVDAAPKAPVVEERTPSVQRITLAGHEERDFTVQVADPDTPASDLDVTWTVDGIEEGWGRDFSVNGEEYTGGEHTVRAIVSDGSAETDDSIRSWTVDVEKPPRIEFATPDDDESVLRTGTTRMFSVGVTDADSFDSAVSTTWTLNGERVATGETFDFDATPERVGRHTLTVRASDEADNTADAVHNWTVRVVGPPRIESRSPAGSVRLGAAGTRQFTVEPADPDTRLADLDIGWQVDGDRRGSGPVFTLSGSDLSGGEHTVRVVVDDGTSITDSVSREWSVELLEPPVVQSASPSADTVAMPAGTSTEFSVDVTDPDTYDSDLRTTWRLDGERVASGERFDLDTARMPVGESRLQAVVADESDLTAEKTHEWTIRVVTPPRIEGATPTAERVRLGASKSKTFTVRASDADSGSLSIRWLVDGARQSTGPSFELDASRLDGREHTVRAVVDDRDETTRDTQRVWNVVLAQPPTIGRTAPGQSEVTISTKGQQSFSVDPVDPDSGDLRTVWRLDGSRVGVGTDHTLDPGSVETGSHTLVAVVDDRDERTSHARREWTVDVVAPPSIVGSNPSGDTVGISETGSRTFRVTGGDQRRTPPTYKWYVDGSQTGNGRTFDFRADQYSAGSHRLSVVATDQSEVTADATRTWTVRVIERPTITSVSPSDTAVPPGKPLEFDVSATDPSGRGISQYVWRIDGRNRTGRHPTYSFDVLGRHTVTVWALNEDGVAASRTFGLTVTNRAPTITAIDTSGGRTTAGSPARLDATVTDPASRDLRYQYEWFVDETRVATTASPNVVLRSVGTHTVRLEVTNEYGAEQERTFDLTVENDHPTITRRRPETERTAVVAERPKEFVFAVADQDRTDLSVRLQSGNDTVASREVTATEQTVSVRHTFESPGNRTVTAIVTDGHGASARTTWRVDVGSTPPEFTTLGPNTDELDPLLSGDRARFNVSARDPEGKGVSIGWFVDDRFVGNGTTYSQTFETAGTYTVRARAADPNGSVAMHNWTVPVRSFRTALTNASVSTVSKPTINVSRERVTDTFLAASMQNPSSNSRSVVVEFLVDTPEGIQASSVADVVEANKAQVFGKSTLQPGEQGKMRIGLHVTDDSLAGQTVPVNVTVRYFPEGHPEDLHIVRQKLQREISITKPDEPGVEALLNGELYGIPVPVVIGGGVVGILLLGGLLIKL